MEKSLIFSRDVTQLIFCLINMQIFSKSALFYQVMQKFSWSGRAWDQIRVHGAIKWVKIVSPFCFCSFCTESESAHVAPADPSAAKSVRVCVSLIYQCVNEFAVVRTQKMSAESVCRHSCTLSCKNVIVCRPDCLQGLRLLNGCRPRCILGVFTPVVKSTCDQT